MSLAKIEENRIQMIKNTILNVVADIRKDSCIDDDTRQKISTYNIENKGTSLNNEVSKIFKQLRKTGDPDVFYSNYYASTA